MLRKMTVLLGSLALALTTFVVAAGQQAQAPTTGTPSVQQQQRRRAARRHFMRRRAQRGAFGALRRLNLTDAQKQQAQSIIKANFESNKAGREELVQLMQKRRQGTLSEAEQARARELRKQLQESRKNARAQLAGLLTAEQRSQLEEMRKNRRERRERFGRRGMNRPI
jgi:Spy/CpxP family protein refolding chaperone